MQLFNKKKLVKIKRFILTFGEIIRKYNLRMFDYNLIVDYNLRNSKPDRDYSAILKFSKDKVCILDIGANHGLISILTAMQNPKALVHAFEASEAAVLEINKNVGYNNLLDRIKIINAVVANKSGLIFPFYWEGSSGGASLSKGRMNHNTEINKVSLGLDDYVKEHKIKPDFIKMDIEGAESLAIAGMVYTLSEFRPLIFLELHEFAGEKLFENAGIINARIKELNYSMFYLRNGLKIVETEILRDRGRAHVLLIPDEEVVKYTVEDLKIPGL
jgi:FkbM family methyltransferase